MDLLATAAMTVQEPETPPKLSSGITSLFAQPSCSVPSGLKCAMPLCDKASVESEVLGCATSPDGVGPMDEDSEYLDEGDGTNIIVAHSESRIEADDCFTDAEVLVRIEAFECPDGYCRTRVPDAKPGRSVMYDYGVICRHIVSMDERWFCLANATCARNSSLGIGGILTVRNSAMKTSSKFCISHLRIVHQKEFPCSRNLKLTNRVDDQKHMHRACTQAESQGTCFNRKEAMARFACPPGFAAQPAGRSIINIYGIRCCSLSSSETRWYCFCDANCASNGTCISIQGFTSTNAVAHLREVHGVLTTRAENKLKRKILEISDNSLAAAGTAASGTAPSSGGMYPNNFHPQPPPPMVLMGHPINPFMRYQGFVAPMPPQPVPSHTVFTQMHSSYAPIAISLSGSISEHDNQLATNEFAHKMLQQCFDADGRYSIAQAIEVFIAPAGFSKDLDSAATKRSIIYKYGCKAIHNQTFALRWFCLASPECAEKSFTGSCGLSMKGDATTNCVNHLRSFHPSLLKSDGNYGAVFNNRHKLKLPIRAPPPSSAAESSSGDATERPTDDSTPIQEEK